MDKEFLERISVGIQLLGYGLFFYLFVIFKNKGQSSFASLMDYGFSSMLYVTDSDTRFFMLASIVGPIILRWMLTGKFKILPFITKDD